MDPKKLIFLLVRWGWRGPAVLALVIFGVWLFSKLIDWRCVLSLAIPTPSGARRRLMERIYAYRHHPLLPFVCHHQRLSSRKRDPWKVFLRRVRRCWLTNQRQYSSKIWRCNRSTSREAKVLH